MGQSFSSIHQTFRGKEEIRLIMLSLDAAGKTTILYRLKLGMTVTAIPTIGFNIETVEHKNIKFSFWDFGGGDKIRPLWRHYFGDAQGIIFVVDSSDRERIGETKEELKRLLEYDEVKDTVLLVFANKQDLPNAMTVSEITDKLDLHAISRHSWYAQAACGTTGSGLHEGLDWLAEQMKMYGKFRFQWPCST